MGMLRILLFVAGGLFALLLIRMLLRERRFGAIRLSQGTGSFSRTGQAIPSASLLNEWVESRQETGGEGDSDDVLQYVPMGSNKGAAVDTKADTPLESDDHLAEILTRIEGLQKKILFQLCLVSLLAFALIVCAGLYFYFQGQ